MLFGIPWYSYLLGLSLFYIWYGVEYIIVRFRHTKQHDSYRDVSFEEEAYDNDENLNYLNTRLPFSWINKQKRVE